MIAIQTHLYIIDASIFIFKYYFSMPNNWFAKNGRPTETVYGYTTWLTSFLKQVNPKNVVACFDESLGTCFRHEIYEHYKCSRVSPDDDLAFQLLACKKMTESLGVSSFASDKYEADDLIASFAAYSCSKSIPYTVLTRDKDLVQTLYMDDSFMWHFPDSKQLSKADIEKDIGISAHQIPTFLALVGDVVDDIPGVPGIGKKTAIALLDGFDSWETIKSNLDRLAELPVRGAKSLKDKLQGYVEQVDMTLQLTTLDSQAMDVTWSSTKRRSANTQVLRDFAKGLGFERLFTQSRNVL